MGVMIVFLLLAVVLAGALLALVARPHLRTRREHVDLSRHTSRTSRASS